MKKKIFLIYNITLNPPNLICLRVGRRGDLELLGRFWA